MAVKDVGKSLGSKATNTNAKASSPRIFGTFESDYNTPSILTPRKFSHYSDFERKREDGTFVIDLVPDVRVFMYGGEVTKDVLSVDISNSLSQSSCTIQLANPKGKYEISRQDLMGKWREDKDIAASYDYDWVKRQKTPNSSLLNIGKKIVGEEVSSLVSGVSDFFSSDSTNTVNSNITKMVFETKFYSGFQKQIGDLVFDYRDPVYVFMKGRFSSFWYFAFSGMITSFDSTDTYGQLQTVTITCGDLLYMLQRKKVATKGSLVMAGNLETSIVNADKTQNTSLYGDLLGSGPADMVVKRILYGNDYFTNVQDCFPLAIVSPKNKYGSLDNFKSAYSEFKAKRKEIGFENKPGYMFTFDDSGIQDTGLSLKSVKNFFTGQQELPKYTYEASTFPKDLGSSNSTQFSPWLPLYFQYNEIRPGNFNGESIKNAYDCTVRYWEKELSLETRFNEVLVQSWKSNKFFGVAGIHPALQYEFISNFNILEDVWQFTRQNKTVIDSLEYSMHDKILESVAGSLKESTAYTKGNNFNHFRPRFFLLLPKKWQNQVASMTGFGEFNLSKEDVTTAYDMLMKLTEKMEFHIYSSPMGDVFMEPRMHDLHPLEFWENIEDRSILKKDDGPIGEQGVPISFRQTLHNSSTNTVCKRSDKAYFFNSEANHPFFFMEKDRKRVTTTFNPENARTSVVVIGSVLNGNIDGRIASGVQNEELIQKITMFSLGNTNKTEGGSYSSSDFIGGVFIADGFTNSVRGNASTYEIEEAALNKYLSQKRDYQNALNEALLSSILSKYKSYTIKALFNEAVSNITALVSTYNASNISSTEIWFQGTIVINELYQKGKSSNLNLDSGDISFTIKENIIISNLVPHLKNAIGIQAFSSSTTDDTLQASTVTADWEKTAIVSQTISSYIPDFNLIDTGLSEESNSTKFHKILNSPEYQNIFNLLLPILVNTNVTIAEINKSIFYLDKTKANMKGMSLLKVDKPVTLSDYKVWAAAGLYNPRDDFMRKYGYNPAPTYVNYYIHNGAEADQFARTYFNRLFGTSFVNKISYVGRPEIFLNRPYYLEKKDCIGLLNTYSLTFSVGQAFSLEGELSYIRKNALTYKYSNDELDPIISVEVPKKTETKNSKVSKSAENIGVKLNTASTDNGNSSEKTGGVAVNSHFATLASDYYQETFGAGLSKLLDNTIGSSLTSVVGSSLVQKAGLDFWNSDTPAGGLYSAHDWIGHMDYDEDGSSVCNYITKQNLKFICQDVTNPEQVNKILNICRSIKQSLDTLKALEDKIDLRSTKLTSVKKEIETKEKEQESANSDKKKITLVPGLKQEVNMLKSEKVALEKEIESYLIQHKNLAITIYGNTVYTQEEKSYLAAETEADRSKWQVRRKPQLDVIAKGDIFTDIESLYCKFKTLLEQLGTKKPVYTYADDRTESSKLETWGDNKIMTPIYVNKVTCDPVTNVTTVVSMTDILFVFTNFDLDDSKYDANKTLIFDKPHINHKKANNPEALSGINTSNQKEISKVINYFVELADNITKITIIGNSSKKSKLGSSVDTLLDMAGNALSILKKEGSYKRANVIKVELLKEITNRLKSETSTEVKGKLQTCQSIINAANVVGKSIDRGYFDDSWLKDNNKKRTDDDVSKIDQRTEIVMEWAKK